MRRPPAHLACCFDAGFDDPFLVFLTSLIAAADEDREIVLHVFRVGADGRFAGLHGRRFGPVTIDLHALAEMPSTRPGSDVRLGAAYLRLFLARLMPELDRVVYFDVDTILLAAPDELFDRDLGGHVLAAVPDAYIWHLFLSPVELDYPWFKGRFDRYMNERLGISRERALGYFNSGLLVLDLARFRKVEAVVMAELEAGDGQFRFYDQCVLNKLLMDQALPIESTWNCLASRISPKRMAMARPEERARVEAQAFAPKLVHYVGSSKPWLVKGRDSPHIDLFWTYALLSPARASLLACVPRGERRIRRLNQASLGWIASLRRAIRSRAIRAVLKRRGWGPEVAV